MTSRRLTPERRDRFQRSALTIVIVVAITSVFFALPEPGSASGQVMFGVTPHEVNGSRTLGLAEFEAQIGREVDLVRDFERWDSSFPGSLQTTAIDNDQLLVISVKAKRNNGTKIKWADIANAAPGSTLHNEMIDWVERIRDLEVPVWFTFHHEPESSSSLDNGNADEFVAAWQRFVDEFRAHGVGNVEFAWIMTSWSFEVSETDNRAAHKWYPGDAYVDHIGSDAYNWDKCRGSSTDYWRTLEDTIEPQRQFGLEHPGKGLFLGEVASAELPGDNGAAKANWIGEMQDLFKQPGWEQFEAVSWFNVTDDSYPGCDWPIDSSTASLAAIQALTDDPFFDGDASPSATTTTTGATTSTTTVSSSTTIAGTTSTSTTVQGTTTTTTTIRDRSDRPRQARFPLPRPCLFWCER